MGGSVKRVETVVAVHVVRKAVGAAAILIGFGSLAVGARADPPPTQVSQDHALVTIHWIGGSGSLFDRVEFYIDHVNVVRLKFGECAQFEVPTGAHTLSVTNFARPSGGLIGSVILKTGNRVLGGAVNWQANQNYYYDFSRTNNFMKSTIVARLSQVDVAVGRGEAAGCHIIPPANLDKLRQTVPLATPAPYISEE